MEIKVQLDLFLKNRSLLVWISKKRLDSKESCLFFARSIGMRRCRFFLTEPELNSYFTGSVRWWQKTQNYSTYSGSSNLGSGWVPGPFFSQD